MNQPSSYRVEEKKSVIFPLVFALAIPILLGIFKTDWLSKLIETILIFFIVLPILCIIKTFAKWVKGEPFFRNFCKNFSLAIFDIQRNSGMSIRKIPWVTSLLIILNIYIFLAVPESIVVQWVFPPYGDPSTAHILASIFSSAFLHADLLHLLGNMMFLWTFGSVLEDRIGPGKYILIYLAAIVLCEVFTMTLLILKANRLNSLSLLLNYHSLGASGAVSGVMGSFIVRCYFARLRLNIPIFMVPAISNPVRVQALIVVCLFFALDLNGSVRKFIEEGCRIAHWAHVGGYLTGFILGYVMKLHRPAAEEAVAQKAERFSAEQENDERATRLYKDVLERHPEDERALWYFLRLYQYDPEKQETIFVRLIQVLMRQGFKKALGLLDDFFPKHIRSIPGDLLLRFGLHYIENSDYFKARLCFEMASEKEGPWRAKAMLKLAEVLAFQGSEALAGEVCSNIVAHFPETPFSKEALRLQKQILKIQRNSGAESL